MPANYEPLKVLIVDNEGTPVEPDNGSKKSVDTLTVGTGAQAQTALSDSKQAFAAVFVNLLVTSPGSGPAGYSVIRFSHFHRVGIPIYILHDGEPPLSPKEQSRLGVHSQLARPFTYSKILELVNKTAFFDPKAAEQSTKKYTEILDQELGVADTEFLPIRAADFLAGSNSFFDVYVRLASRKYIKILQAGDSFSLDRIGGYLAKGVTHFFIRKETQLQYLAYCDELSSRILKMDNVPLQLKTSQVLNHGEETMSFLRNNGLSESNVNYAKSFVSNMRILVEQLKPDENANLKGFLSDIVAYEHGVSTSMIACLIGRQVGIESGPLVQIVGMSSLLHDIGLFGMPPELHDEDESKMNVDQKALYHTHPALGAKILRDIRGIDPAVVQAVVQHHERRDQSGFPSGLGALKIYRVGEIVGISDEFVRLIVRMKAQKASTGEMQKEFDQTVLDGFSYPITEAFRTLFFKQE